LVGGPGNRKPALKLMFASQKGVSIKGRQTDCDEKKKEGKDPRTDSRDNHLGGKPKTCGVRTSPYSNRSREGAGVKVI